jgi:8-amino-7-oxononanoate synthase
VVLHRPGDRLTRPGRPGSFDIDPAREQRRIPPSPKGENLVPIPPEGAAEAGFVRRDPRWSDLERLRTDGLMYDAVIEEIQGRNIRVGDDWLVDFASCNYLGFDLEPEIMTAIDVQVRRWGTHPSWSRLLGNPRLYLEIEERLTELLGAPDTLVLPTITLIHMSVIPVLAGQGTVFVEAEAHKTIYDGCAYARGLGATVRRFRTGDPAHLEELLRAAPARTTRLVCMDGVNSMTGNLADLPAFARLCREYGALLYVDDAHGFGIVGERRPDETSPYGARGNAIVRHCDESYDNVILVGGFSKSYSSLLAFLALPTALKNHLKVAAPPYLYSGPSPVASLATVLAGFDVNQARGDKLRADLYRMCARVLSHVRALGLTTPNNHGTPIVELPLAPGHDLTAVARTLWRHGIYVTLAPYPLVPRANVGFRIQITAAHTDPQIDQLIEALTVLAGEGALRQLARNGGHPADGGSDLLA